MSRHTAQACGALTAVALITTSALALAGWAIVRSARTVVEGR